MQRRQVRSSTSPRGQGMIEYGLVLALIALVVIAVLTVVGRRTATAVCQTSAGFASGSSRYAQAVLGDCPLAYWRLDETAGTTAADLSGRGFAGTYTGTVALGSAGATADGDKAMGDSGGGNVVITTTPALLGVFQNHDFSVDAWVYFPATSTGDDGILEAGVAGTDTKLHLLRRSNSLYMGFYADDALGTTVLSVNTWYHVAFTWSASTRLQTIYVNGAVDVTRTSTGTLQVPAGQPVSLASYFGTRFNGTLDEVAVYDHVLTAAQVLAHYQAAPLR